MYRNEGQPINNGVVSHLAGKRPKLAIQYALSLPARPARL